MAGTYNGWLVVAALAMGVLASYTAFDMATRVGSVPGQIARWWRAGGSVALAVGVWSMHFLAMLAFHLPISMGYDPEIVFLSLLVAVASSFFAFWIVCRPQPSRVRVALGALLIGTGVACMHYTGMAAMEMNPPIRYSRPLFLLSVVIAVAASGAGFGMASRRPRKPAHVKLLRSCAALVMGGGIAGMHFTGMAAAQFSADSVCAMGLARVPITLVALLILFFAGGVVSFALVTSLLDASIRAHTAVLQNSLEDANRRLEFLAMHDRLTGLPNRTLLEDRLEQELRNARRLRSRLSVLFMDLDGFKQINDAFGHHIGDRLLVEAANRIRTVPRERDTLARIGGDEFVLLVNSGDPGDVANLANRLVSVVSRSFVIDGSECWISLSLGVAIYDGGEADAADLLQQADIAMYRAKTQGRNGYCFFEASMNADAQKQVQLFKDLSAALERRELMLHYQPKFDAADGSCIGAEALLRWHHPAWGPVPLNLFIPVAEKTRLIIPIGQWVLEEACRQMRAWRDAGLPLANVAVNFSAHQLSHPGLVSMVNDTLERYALEPRNLTLEITESSAMHNVEVSVAILQQLHEMGVRISIDDFGTGYSSLLYLKRLSASELKIDRQFVRDLTSNPEDAAIVAAIVAMGRTLHLKIVAEGVETVEQREFLARLGCDSLQGYLLGRPMPADEFFRTALAGKHAAGAPVSIAEFRVA